MKDIKLVATPSSPRLSPHSFQQISITFGVKTIVTFPLRISCVINSSARRVLPTRVVPNTRRCPTRSVRLIKTLSSSISTPCIAELPPTGGNGRTGLKMNLVLSGYITRGMYTHTVVQTDEPGVKTDGFRKGATSGRFVSSKRWVCFCSHIKPFPRNKNVGLPVWIHWTSDTGVTDGYCVDSARCANPDEF